MLKSVLSSLQMNAIVLGFRFLSYLRFPSGNSVSQQKNEASGHILSFGVWSDFHKFLVGKAR